MTNALDNRLSGALRDAGIAIDAAAEARLRSALISSVDLVLTIDDTRLINELRGLSDYIEQARSELASMHAEEIKGDHIRTATDELDAVVSATETATGNIMDSCERIEVLAEGMDGDTGDSVVAEVTSIYEACSFQDITGQRISKVVNTLKHIETRVAEMVAGLEPVADGPAKASAPLSDGNVVSDTGLLNGPQLPGNGVDQDMVDRLLSGGA